MATAPTAQVFITPRLKRVMDVANEEAKKLEDEYISTEHIFLAIASERNTPSANILREAGVTKERIYEAIEEMRNGQRVTEPNAESKYRVLEKYGRDLTEAARRRQARPGHRARCRGAARDAGAQPPYQEQPGAHRRGRRGQDGHCRRAGPDRSSTTMCRSR